MKGGTMPFVSMPGMPGKMYVPEKQAECLKKFSCKDCFSCEFCSDDRCRVCRVNKTTIREKTSINEVRKG